ncbi:hypothetical protein P8452_12842 [Trifolium repens]|nr:hypothetical protein P8452_12842 [Trifolium repens]
MNISLLKKTVKVVLSLLSLFSFSSHIPLPLTTTIISHSFLPPTTLISLLFRPSLLLLSDAEPRAFLLTDNKFT